MPATYLQFEVYNPATGQTLTLNDVTSDPDKLYTISEPPQFRMGVRTTKQNRLGRHFVKSQYSFYEERLMLFKGQIAVFNNSVSDLETMVSNLKQIFALPPLPDESNDGFIYLKWTDARGLSWQVRAKVLSDVYIEPIFGVPFLRTFNLELMAEDGYIYSQTEFTASTTPSYYATVSTLPITLPVTLVAGWVDDLVVTNLGNFPSPPRLRITGTGAGVIDPKIEIVETGKSIELTGLTIATGRYVEIDIAEGTIEYDDGTDYSQYLTNDSDWIYLNPGANTVRFTHTGSFLDGLLGVYWRNTEI